LPLQVVHELLVALLDLVGGVLKLVQPADRSRLRRVRRKVELILGRRDRVAGEVDVRRLGRAAGADRCAAVSGDTTN
jgi:hypothetical protein